MVIHSPSGRELYLQSYDVEAYDGRGSAHWCLEQGEALRFASALEVMQAWRTQSKRRPWRDDGKANRPLTAFTIEPRVLG
jgi:hypothetical protein